VSARLSWCLHIFYRTLFPINESKRKAFAFSRKKVDAYFDDFATGCGERQTSLAFEWVWEFYCEIYV
jgi:hypothetical protein